MNKDIAQKSKQVLFVLTGFLMLAISINFVILEFFDQKSSYRTAHSLVGIILLMGFVYTFSGNKISRAKLISLFLISLIPCYLGTVFSDLDISLLGIGGHRNPIFHSGILFFIFLILTKKSDSYMVSALVSAFGVGLGSHLIWDMFDKGDVRWIPGGTLDTVWLGVNGMLCILSAKINLSHRI
ncbi:MAG: hypothetical protein U9P10_12905 [Thermodesulfobacteriota bacterium]|nr:hypothetical protein [Thermodesulfobacteriota bacterium]